MTTNSSQNSIFFKSCFMIHVNDFLLFMATFWSIECLQNILTTPLSMTPRWTSKRPSSGTSAGSVYNVLIGSKVIFLHLLVLPSVIFNESAHWADSVIQSRCPSACMYVPCEEDISFHWRGLLHRSHDQIPGLSLVPLSKSPERVHVGP